MHDRYENPLLTRYASAEMASIWSAQTKHGLWRRLWVALAEAERELGLDIRPEQIEQLRGTVDDIDFDAAERFEKELRHDVMAHVHAWGEQCPAARPIIHLGATSCYVTDNSELIQTKRSLELIRDRLVRVIDALGTFAEQWKALPCLGFTHLQPAQPVTVGKRATLWCYDLVLDLEEIEHRLATLRFRGVKGTTGTQATFLTLLGGDHAKVEQLDRLVTTKMGFDAAYPVTGQTYSRKVDAQVLATLGGIGQSCHKAGSDLRILQHRKEVEEPFEEKQIGSSAMAYKRNPMRAERMCGLARFAMSLTQSGEATAATQWLERTLDDSANRRLTLPQSFLAIDASLVIYRNVASGLVVYPKVIESNLNAELPFMATEEILMAGVRTGGDRQDLHERIRIHSVAAAKQVKEEGKPNDLMDRLQTDRAFAKVDLTGALDATRFVGRAPQQVEGFLREVVGPVRERYAGALTGEKDELRV
ncbi:MAG: adenylosuccinate lyase [Planctomycetaceae bacterium]